MKSKTAMAVENLCLRQQVAVLSLKSPRPRLAKRDRRRLIRQISRDNSFWGMPMIQKVLALLGYEVSTSTVWKYLDRSVRDPSMTWRGG